MAEIQSYVIINGDVSERTKYEATVTTQKEVDNHKEIIRSNHSNKCGDFGIRFVMKYTPEEVKKKLHRKLFC